MGVGPRMANWIFWCVKIVLVSVMINGNPTQPFRIHKGLRQGDPVSQFLFTIVGEALSYVITRAKNCNLIKGLKIGKDNVELTHIQFADETLLFLPQDSTILMNYKRLLDCSGLMSGLQVNFDKSSLVSWHSNSD